PDLPDDITGPLRVSLGPPQSYPHPGKPSPSFPGSFFLPALSTRPLTDARFAKRLVRLQTYMRRSPLGKSRTFAVGRKWAAELTGVLCVVLLLPSSRAAGGQEPSEKFDLVILHGRVVDPESGQDAVRNIAIKDGNLRAVTTDPLAWMRTVETTGLVLAPGFIDLHEHGQAPRNYEFQAHDGVTTSLELEAGTDDVDGWYDSRQGKSLINFGV